MKNIRNVAVLTALISSISAGLVSAGLGFAREDKDDEMHRIGSRLDRQITELEDGFDRERYLKRASRHFDEMDANGDGRVTRQEMHAWSKQQKKERKNYRREHEAREEFELGGMTHRQDKLTDYTDKGQ